MAASGSSGDNGAMNTELRGHSILVTGGASGIGLATTRLLLAEGAQVTICGGDEEQLSEATAKLGSDDLATCVGNVLNPQHAAAAVKTAMDRFGQIDGLTALAGQGQHGSLLEMGMSTITGEISGKVAGLLNMVRQSLPALIASQGRIVAVTAPTALQPDPAMGAVSAARAAVDNVVSSLALELAPAGVRVNGVGVGLIDTQRQRARYVDSGSELTYDQWLEQEVHGRGIPLERPGTASEVASTIVFLLSPRSSYSTGAVVDVAGGLRSR